MDEQKNALQEIQSFSDEQTRGLFGFYGNSYKYVQALEKQNYIEALKIYHERQEKVVQMAKEMSLRYNVQNK